jgi:tetratricopeptide (TPR) repeat protein/HEAT repeat protein
LPVQIQPRIGGPAGGSERAILPGEVLFFRIPGSALLLVLAVCAPARADDWSLTREPRSRPAARARSPQPTRPGTAATPPAADRRGALIERYLAALLHEPAQDFAFEKLLALVRERDGQLDRLVEQLSALAAAEPGRAAAPWLLARVQLEAGQRDAARESFARAVQLAPTAAGPLRGWASLERSGGDPVRARQLLEQALPHSRAGAERTALQRELAELALDVGDLAAAEAHYEAAARDGAGGGFLAAEYARALSARGAHAAAVAAYQKLIARQRGDNRGLPPLLVELARAQLETGDVDAALASLWRARELAQPGSGLRHEVHAELLEQHRRAGRLEALVSGLANAGQGDADALDSVGQALEELGRSEPALAAYRKVLLREPKQVAARQRMIRLLTREGRLDEVVLEARELVRHSPDEPRFVVELAELLMQTGRRLEALEALARAARAHPRDAPLHEALHRIYTRWNEPVLAERALQTLVRIEPRDPAHLVVLGEQQLARGDRAAALDTWKRITRAAGERGRGHALLGELYLDHDLPIEALAELEEAARLLPNEPAVARSLAEARERNQDPAGALEQWSKVLSSPQADAVQRREARRRTVQLWAEAGSLRGQLIQLEAGLRAAESLGSAAAGAPSAAELESLRLLAEAHERLGRGGPTGARGAASGGALREAERTLERIVKLAPGDLESLEALERLRAARGDLEGAIAALEAALQADPRRAKEYLSRMARHALALYRDDAALRYAERAVAFDPADAEAQRRLGGLYRAAQRNAEAIESYRRALDGDPHLFGVQLELAELLLTGGHTDEADRVLRSVVRGCPDDELVARAARSAMQLALAAADRARLEDELLALALGHPGRAVFRKLLVELYDARVPALAQQAEAGDVAAAEALRSVGHRALKPLLEALADAALEQQRMAVRILARLGNPAAVGALFAVVNSSADTDLRRQALQAAARLASAEHSARFVELGQAPERRLREIAAWALARIGDPASVAALRGMLDSGMPSIRGHAALGLGRARVKDERVRLEQALRSDRSEWVRGSAALALGLLAEPTAVDALVSALRTDATPIAAAAALALGWLGDSGAAEALAEAAFATDPRLRRAALAGLTGLAPGARSAQPAAGPPASEHAELEPLLDAWLARTPVGAAATQLSSSAHSALAQAARAALGGPVERVRTALELISGGVAQSGVPLQPSALSAELAQQLRLASLAELRAVLAHPEPALRLQALRLLASMELADTTAAIVTALDDADPAVRGFALEQVRPRPDLPLATLTVRLAGMARDDAAWWMRRRAVDALGRLGGESARGVLLEVLAADRFAYVREAAASALAQQRHPTVRAALARSLASDAELGVRVAAARALSEMPEPEAARLLEAAPPEVRARLAATPGTSDSRATVPQ